MRQKADLCEARTDRPGRLYACELCRATLRFATLRYSRSTTPKLELFLSGRPARFAAGVQPSAVIDSVRRFGGRFQPGTSGPNGPLPRASRVGRRKRSAIP